MAVVITTQIESIIFSNLTIYVSELQQCDQMLYRRSFLALRGLSYRIGDIQTFCTSFPPSSAVADPFVKTHSDIFSTRKEKVEFP
jgi:hypothetical protein